MEFDEAGGHHHEVSHHGVAADELAEGGDHFLDRGGDGGVLDDVNLEGVLGLLGPFPGVGEGFDLGGGFLAGALAEEDVVGGVGVEGRVEVDQVDGGVGDVVAQDGEVVAVEEGVRNSISGP